MYHEREAESAVSIKLIASNIDSNVYIAKVPRTTVNVDQLVTEIIENNPGVDAHTLNHCAELFKHEILRQISEGKAVNMFDIGTAYVAPVASVAVSAPEISKVDKFTLKFTPSKQANKALSMISTESYMITDSTPLIQEVISLKDGSCNLALHKKFGARITGTKLKLGGTDSGIYLVPVGDDGNPVKDESKWICCSKDYIPCNKPKSLEFNVPPEAETGIPYYIAVRTSYVNSSKLRKTPLTGFSPKTVVIEE